MEHRRQSKRKRAIMLTEGIFFEILLRLPVRSLLRGKSVCKLWYSLISNQHFINSHVRLSTIKSHMDKSPLTRNKLMFRINEPIAPNPHYPTFPCMEAYGDPHIEIVGSCNGLLCIVERRVTLIIYNPSTRKLNTLPRPADLIKQEGFVQKYAFGYDESNDDYKVIALHFLRRTPLNGSDESKKLVKIYSLKTGKWKSINDFPDVLTTPNNGMFLNGALHWVGLKDINMMSSWTIVSLDLAKETYGEISLPMYEEDHPGSVTLGLMGKWLCIMCGYLMKPVDVWVMKDYGVKDSWTRLLSFPLTFRDRAIYRAPLCISNNGKVLLHFNTKLVVYDSMSDSFTDIHKFERFYQACTIVESLVSPHAPLKRNKCSWMRKSRKRANLKHC